MPVGPARAISFEPGGRGVVIGRNSGDPARWKRYRGGTAGTLWVDRAGEGEFASLVRLPGNLANPMWIGGRIYFLSDHEGFGNLYSCTPGGRDLRRHTHQQDFYVRFPATDGARIVFQSGGDLHLYDPERERAAKLDIRTRSSQSQRNRKFVAPGRYLESVDLHPAGHSIAAVSRGGVYTMGLWEGASARHGAGPGVRYRLATWLPDGKRIVAVSDEGGEEKLAVLRVGLPEQGSRRSAIRRIEGDFGRPIELAVAPAGPDRVAITNQRQELWLVDLASGKRVMVERSEAGRIDGLAWSPDGRYLAYGFPETRRVSTIRLADLTNGKLHHLTRPEFRDMRPAFDPEGRYLYFISWRVLDPVYDSIYFDLGFPRGARPYLIPLRKDLVSPFSAEVRPLRAPGLPFENGDEESERQRMRAGAEMGEAKKPVVVQIDLDGIMDRVVALPVSDGRYGRILGGRGRILFSVYPIEGSLDQDWVPSREPEANGMLSAYDFARERVETIAEHVTDFSTSADGKVMAIRSGNRIRVLPVHARANGRRDRGDIGRESGWIDLDRLRVSVVPADEWRQMFREAWRLQRDQFWTSDMSGIDWQAAHDRYLPLVARVASRAEFSDLLWEMQGELGTSHCYELGGDYRPEPGWFQGHLGADLDLDPQSGRWRVRRIPKGDSWDDEVFSPLAAPGLNIRRRRRDPGRGGRRGGARHVTFRATREPGAPERGSHDPHCRQRRAERGRAALAAAGKVHKAGAVRTVTVKTLVTEFGLRYRDWIARNRERVHAATDGRVGYIHVPDMSPHGYSEFHRSYLSEVDRDGLVIDVRWNGGGPCLAAPPREALAAARRIRRESVGSPRALSHRLSLGADGGDHQRIRGLGRRHLQPLLQALPSRSLDRKAHLGRSGGHLAAPCAGRRDGDHAARVRLLVRGCRSRSRELRHRSRHRGRDQAAGSCGGTRPAARTGAQGDPEAAHQAPAAPARLQGPPAPRHDTVAGGRSRLTDYRYRVTIRCAGSAHRIVAFWRPARSSVGACNSSLNSVVSMDCDARQEAEQDSCPAPRLVVRKARNWRPQPRPPSLAQGWHVEAT